MHEDLQFHEVSDRLRLVFKFISSTIYIEKFKWQYFEVFKESGFLKRVQLQRPFSLIVIFLLVLAERGTPWKRWRNFSRFFWILPFKSFATLFDINGYVSVCASLCSEECPVWIESRGHVPYSFYTYIFDTLNRLVNKKSKLPQNQ